MSIESISVSSFMTRNIKTETEDQNLRAVCKTMNENNIGSIIIVKSLDGNSGKPIGIITERDVVRIIGSLQPSLLQMPMRELMSKPLITLSTNHSIKDAIQTMQLKNIRRLPIVEKEHIEGIITDKDIFRAIMNNSISLDSLLTNNALIEQHGLVFDQYREYFLNDIVQRR